MSLIIALDFDGTLFGDGFPEIGEPRHDVIEQAKLVKKYGGKLLLWTCRDGIHLQHAVDKCAEHGLYFDAVNDNDPELKKYLTCAKKKIFAIYYIDDRAPGSIDYFLKMDIEKECENLDI